MASTHLEPALEVPALEQRRRQRPAGPAAGRRHRAARQAATHPMALLAAGRPPRRGCRGSSAPRPARRAPRTGCAGCRTGARLHRRLGHLERLGHAALDLERVALDAASAAPAGVPRRSSARSRCRGRRGRSPRRSARGSSRPSPGSRAPPAGARARRPRAGRHARAPRRGARAPPRCRPRRPRPGRAPTRRRRSGRRRPAPARCSSAAAHLQRLLEVAFVEPVDAELDLERRGRRASSGRAPPPRPGPAARGPRRGGPASARPRRTGSSAPPGARRSRAGAARWPRAASLRQRSSSPTERSAEASATRTDTWRSVSPLGSSRRAASNQRAAASGARGAAEPPGLEQELDRRLVALAAPTAPRGGRARWPAAPRAASTSAARACAASRQPPRDGVVDRAAHERVAEGEPARHLGGANEVQVEQVVERVERLARSRVRRSPRRGRARTARRPRPRPRAAPRGVLGSAASSSGDARRPRRRARRPLPLAVVVGGARPPSARRGRAARGRRGCRRRGCRWRPPPPRRARRAAAGPRLGELARARAA